MSSQRHDTSEYVVAANEIHQGHVFCIGAAPASFGRSPRVLAPSED